MQLSTRVSSLLARNPGTRPADLARLAGVSTASVADWMSGTTKSMKPEPARKLALHFGCDQVWLMTGVGDPSWRGEAGSEQPVAAPGTRANITLRAALEVVREHLARGGQDQTEKAGEALRLMATVPDSDRAFEQAVSVLSSIK